MAAAGAEGRVSLLRELAEIGMDLARSLRRQVVEAEDDAAPAVDAGEAALAFSRLSRAVRLTLALEAKAEEGERNAPGRDAKGRSRLAALSLWTPQETLVLDRRALVSQAIDQAIEAEADGDEAMMDRLTAEAEDWLDEEIDEADFLNRPTLELAALICRELGVPFDPGLWADESPSSLRGGVGVSAQDFPVGDVGLGSSPGAALAPPPDPLRGLRSPRGGGEMKLADGGGVGAPFDPGLSEDKSPSPLRGGVGVGVSAQGSPVAPLSLDTQSAALAPPPDPLRGPPSPRGGGEMELTAGVGVGAARTDQSP